MHIPPVVIAAGVVVMIVSVSLAVIFVFAVCLGKQTDEDMEAVLHQGGDTDG